MPYIDSTPALSPFKIREGNLQQGFKEMLIKHGWTKALEFKKAVTSTHFVTEHATESLHEDKFTVVNHIIMRSARGDLFGVAVAANWSGYTDHDNGFPYYNWFTSLEEDKTKLTDYLAEQYENQRAETTLYYYMLDRLPAITEGEVVLTPWGLEAEDDLRLQMALDVEVTAIDFKSTNAGSEYIKTANPAVMQSPIVESALRAPFLENIDYPYMDTNWWADSEVSFKGHLDSKSMFLVIQTDNTPMWEDNVVPIVPLYFGEIDALDEGDPAIALFAGTTPRGDTPTEVAGYDFENATEDGGKRINPILKKYPSNPSNGVDSVMINRTKLGARYQSYFLSWNTAPNAMPPERESADGLKQYPRSIETDGKFQFNPSRYSGKVQTSRVYLVHPEEGVRGHLKGSVGLNSANLNSSELRIRQADCPDKIFDVYQCIPVSAVSPLTKRPSTHFRPMGLGLYKEELNITNPVTVDKSDVIAPKDVTDLESVETSKGIVKITWTAPTDKDLVGYDITVAGEPFAIGVVGVTDYVLVGLTMGSTEIKVISYDLNGNRSVGSTTTVTVS